MATSTMAASAMTTPAIMAPKSLRTNIPLTGHSITLTGQLFSLPTTTDSLREAPTATGCFLFPSKNYNSTNPHKYW